MTKYEELTALALQQYAAVAQAEQACVGLALNLVNGLRAFLGIAPADRIGFYLPFAEVGNTPPKYQPLPQPVQRDDGFYYFGVNIQFWNQIHFVSSVGFVFGLQKQDDHFVLRERKDNEIRTDADLQAWYERLYQSFKTFYESPLRRPKEPFGFHLKK